jgi:uncharacterized protein YqeY
MNTRERIDNDFAKEFKARNASATSTLRMLRATLKNAEIEKMKPLEEEEVVELVGREVKKLKDAMESFKAGGRQDLIAQTDAELSVLGAYLPAQLDDDALRAIVKEKVAAAGAVTAKDFGKIMAEVMKDAKGRAEGSKVGQLVKEALAQAVT